ncbi:MAG: hypothetical protein ACOYK8_06295 [Alphaproteobacteria bacterium]
MSKQDLWLDPYDVLGINRPYFDAIDADAQAELVEEKRKQALRAFAVNEELQAKISSTSQYQKHVEVIDICVAVLLNTTDKRWDEKREKIIPYDDVSTSIISFLDSFRVNLDKASEKLRNMSFFPAPAPSQSPADIKQPIINDNIESPDPFEILGLERDVFYKNPTQRIEMVKVAQRRLVGDITNQYGDTDPEVKEQLQAIHLAADLLQDEQALYYYEQTKLQGRARYPTALDLQMFQQQAGQSVATHFSLQILSSEDREKFQEFNQYYESVITEMHRISDEHHLLARRLNQNIIAYQPADILAASDYVTHVLELIHTAYEQVKDLYAPRELFAVKDVERFAGLLSVEDKKQLVTILQMPYINKSLTKFQHDVLDFVASSAEAIDHLAVAKFNKTIINVIGTAVKPSNIETVGNLSCKLAADIEQQHADNQTIERFLLVLARKTQRSQDTISSIYHEWQEGCASQAWKYGLSWLNVEKNKYRQSLECVMADIVPIASYQSVIRNFMNEPTAENREIFDEAAKKMAHVVSLPDIKAKSLRQPTSKLLTASV